MNASHKAGVKINTLSLFVDNAEISD